MIKQSIYQNARKKPPGPPGFPIIGCFLQMSTNPLQFLTNSAREYGGVVHLGSIGPQQLYLIADPDSIKYVLQENPQNYTKGENFQDIKLVIGEGLVISEGDSWRSQRRLMQPSFHRQQIAAMVNDMTQLTAEMVERWQKIPPGATLDISAEMLVLTQKILLKTTLSIDADSDTSELIQAWNTIYKFLSDRLWAIIKPPISFPTPKNRQFKQAINTLRTVANNIIQQRKQSNHTAHDILSMFMNTQDESGEGLSDQQLHDQIVGLFSAGFETSAVTLGWIWYLLSKYPTVERELQAELATVLAGRTPTFEDLPHLKYTKMVVQEAMRLYPGAWVYARNNLGDDLIGGYHIPAGSMLLFSPFVTHRLPTFWDNPEGFDPERFTPERSVDRPRYAYFPFGGGQRQCLGDIFALTEIQLIVAMVCQRFRLNLLPEHPVEPQPLLTLQTRKGILMTLQPRTELDNVSQLNTQKTLLTLNSSEQ
ncbi:MAG: cytochrome P450 [Nostoc sp. DedQUE12b]|uniref:cytochrome P450 n=1 Tax=Nostoc sp. DedQUE12b TaxID=3075398 RepID=UPI002AD586BB|nr:cytochrome P450 [Nostoc sp. DedQUE12b]MDZ8089893.1 cytochrome P450 [Nostoc sp. DedQUE12b]